MLGLFAILIPILASDALFQKINDKMDRISSVLIPLIMILLGGALIADTIVFFSSGKALF